MLRLLPFALAVFLAATLPAGFVLGQDTAAVGDDGPVVTVLATPSTTEPTLGETFTIDSPTDVLKWFTEERKYFQQFFGEGSAKSVRPEVDEGILLGEADKSGEFEFRSITVQEQIKVD